MQGKLIVFEGVEGSGKTTQIQRSRYWLLERMNQKPSNVVVTREPGGTTLGSRLRQLLLQGHQHPIQDRTELLIFAADRAQHVEEVINPTLLAGGIILCDRFTDSTIAYQGYGRGLSLELIENICQVATDGRTSDLTLWLDIDVEVGLARAKARGTADRMEQADLAFHRRVQQGFTALAAAYPHRIVRVDASRSEAEVQEQIQMILTQKFAQWYPDNSFSPD